MLIQQPVNRRFVFIYCFLLQMVYVGNAVLKLEKNELKCPNDFCVI